MTKLGVNIDHSATLRQARYRGLENETSIVIEPDPVEIALAAERGGADSITAHLREDRRHMQDADIKLLRQRITTKLNLEMACSEEIIKFASNIRPDYVCLVPENRLEVTTEGGVNLVANKDKTARAIEILSGARAVCSVFVDPDEIQIKIAHEIGAAAVELHTGAYANAWGNPPKKLGELNRLAAAQKFAESLGLIVNSGHGINYENVGELVRAAKFNELNIGHTIISRSLLVGMERATAEMKELINAR